MEENLALRRVEVAARAAAGSLATPKEAVAMVALLVRHILAASKRGIHCISIPNPHRTCCTAAVHVQHTQCGRPCTYGDRDSLIRPTGPGT